MADRRPPSGKPVKSEPVFERRSVGLSIEEMMKITRNQLFFVTNLSNRVFPENAKVKLSCVVQGPDPNIRWIKDDTPIVYSARVKNLSRDGLCVLEISSCTPDDSGIYKIIAKNQDSEITCTCKLQVYATSQVADIEPTFTRNLKRKD